DNQVDAAFDETLGLLAKHFARLFDRSWSKRLDADSQRSNCAGDKGSVTGCLASDASAGVVDLINLVFEPVTAQLDAIRSVRIALDDVSAGLYVVAQDAEHDIVVR